MSGLLPRTQPNSGAGTFTSLTVQSLDVTAAAFINTLVSNSISTNSINISMLSIGTINGTPNLNLVGTDVTVNGTDILTTTNTEIVSNKTIDSAANTLTITNSPLSGANVNTLINQPLLVTSSPSFGSVVTIGAVIAGSGCQGLFGHFNTINDETVANLCTVNGVNPLTTNTNLTAHIAATTAHGTTSSIVGINDAQTLTNKTLTAPIISTISNTGTLTLPTTTGTLALVSQIPTNATFVDLTTTQTITGSKIFSTPPTMVSILNGGALSLPTITDTLVGRTTTDTLTNKTITAPVIGTIINTGTLTLPTTTGTLALVSQIPTSATYVDLTSTQTITGAKTFSTSPTMAAIINTGTLTLPTVTTTLDGINNTSTLTNKTIDSAGNTLTITNSPLSGANVNALINQDVRTTASPTFTTGVSVTTAGNSTFAFTGKGELSYSGAAGAFFSSAQLADINIRNQNTANSVNIGVGAATAQLNITDAEVNYNVPTNLYVGGAHVENRTPISVASTFGVAVTLETIAIPTNSIVGIYVTLNTIKLTGTITGDGSYLYDWRAVNNAGTVTTAIGNNQSKSESAIVGGFGGKTVIGVAVSGTNVLVQVTNTFVDGTLSIGGVIVSIYA